MSIQALRARVHTKFIARVEGIGVPVVERATGDVYRADVERVNGAIVIKNVEWTGKMMPLRAGAAAGVDAVEPDPNAPGGG